MGREIELEGGRRGQLLRGLGLGEDHQGRSQQDGTRHFQNLGELEPIAVAYAFSGQRAEAV